MRWNPIAAAVVSSAGGVGVGEEDEEGIAVAATPVLGLGLGLRVETAATVGSDAEVARAETLRKTRRWATGLCRGAAAVAQLPCNITLPSFLPLHFPTDFCCLYWGAVANVQFGAESAWNAFACEMMMRQWEWVDWGYTRADAPEQQWRLCSTPAEKRP